MAASQSPVAFITGGASGIGLAVAKDLLAKKWNLTIFDFNEKSLSSIEQDFDNDRAIIIKGDVSDYASQGEAFAKTWDRWHRLDFVFANAGIVDRMDFYAPATNFLEGEGVKGVPARPNFDVMDINCSGAIYTAYLALQFFHQNATLGGELVITASEAGLYPVDSAPLYTAAKHALVGFTRALAKKLGGGPIQVNCICPGLVATALTASYTPSTPPEMTTSMSTVLQAVDQFIEDHSLTGKVAECSHDGIFYREMPEYKDQAAKFLMSAPFEL